MLHAFQACSTIEQNLINRLKQTPLNNQRHGSSTKTRSALPDLIRFCAVFLLLTAHIGQEIKHPIGGYFGIPEFYQVSLGGLAVTLYLFVSGAGLELADSRTVGNRRMFILKRLLRIYPVYYMSLVVGILVAVALAFRASGSGLQAFSGMTFLDWSLSLTGMHAFAGSWGGPFLTTGWFIGLIVSLYILYPGIAFAMRKYPHHTIFLALMISVSVRLFLGHYPVLPMRPLDWFPLCRLFEFAAGMYAVRLMSAFILKIKIVDRRIRTLVNFVNEISFPLFLVHYPFLFLIHFFTAGNLGLFMSISLYLGISILISWLILKADRSIPRDRIIAFVANRILLRLT